MTLYFTVKLRPVALDCINLRYRQLGYKSRNAYLKALIRQDCLEQPEHTIPLKWSKLPLFAQDRIENRILKELTKP